MKAFVSYQRADTAMAAHALFYALRTGGHDAFVDTGDIGAGQTFRSAIAQAVSGCHVMLALIGPAFGVARLAEPTSVVAFEWQRARFHGLPVVPVLVDGAGMPPDAALPPALRWFTRRNALVLRVPSLATDIAACVAAVAALGTEPRRAARVLWVDDRPSNNEELRKSLRPHGIVFDCVVSTAEALDQLREESYDLVITDVGRTDSSDRSGQAGRELLRHPLLRDGGPPVIVYAGFWVHQQRERLLAEGAHEATANPLVLERAVLQSLGREASGSAELTR